MKNLNVNRRKYNNVGISKKLFGDEYEYVEWIENLMNVNLESKFISIVDKYHNA